MDVIDEINNSIYSFSNLNDHHTTSNSILEDDFMINFISEGDQNNNSMVINHHSDSGSDTPSDSSNDFQNFVMVNSNSGSSSSSSCSGSNNGDRTSHPSSPLVPNSSPFAHDNLGSPETLSPFDTIPTSAQYNEFLNSFKPIQQSPFTGILEQTTVNNSNSNQGEVYFSSSISSSSNSPLVVPMEHDMLGETSLVSSSANVDNGSATSTTTKPKISKKRISESRVQNIVHPLTREELLKQMGKEPVKVVDQPTNTLEEERTVKKQRRLIKNRESAQLSRMRKKIYIEDLEKKISDLTSDNQSLKDEVVYLQGLVKKLIRENNNNTSDVALIDVNNNSNNNNSNHIHNNNNHHNKSKNIKTAGVCLLLIFFSFGVFFQNTSNSNNGNGVSLTFPSPNQERTTHSILSLPEQTTSTTNDNTLPNPRLDKNIYKDTNDQKALLTVHSKDQNKKRLLDDDKLDSKNKNNNDHNNNSPKKRIRITNLEDEEELLPTIVGNDDRIVTGGSTTTSSSSLLTNNNNNNNINSNLRGVPSTHSSPFGSTTSHSSYIICSDSPRIVSNNITQTTESILNSNSSSPLTIGLLLPANSLDLSVDTPDLHGHSTSERSILEISCQISNIRIWNYQNNPLDANSNPLQDQPNSIVISTL